jgi:DNA-binding response OmpR family regulator
MKSDDAAYIEAVLRKLSATLGSLAQDCNLALDVIARGRGRGADPFGGLGRATDLVDDARFVVRWNGRECGLGNTLIFRLLRRLATSPNRYVSHQDLIDDVWGAERSSVAVRTVVRNLRRRLEAAGMEDLASAIDGRNAGYYALRLDRVGQPGRRHRKTTDTPP